MAIEKLTPDFQFDEERLKKLYEIAPEAFADGKVNWLSLQEALGNFKEDDDVDSEHFGLFWPGKREARKISSKLSTGTLQRQYGDGFKEDDAENIFIEGDNLEVLKLLQKAYNEKIKMIYIDPPYNTGNDFVYDDDYSESLEDYLRRTGQLDEDGKPYNANTKSGGKYHSNWLSMIYPRLRLARNLLKDDGMIFISIDDNEMYHLRMVMNEIFGEENFIACIAWRRTDNQPNIGSFARVKEYILIYSKSKFDLSMNKLGLTEKAKKEYRYEDEEGKFRRAILLDKTRGRHYYEVITKGGKKLKGPWMIKEADFKKLDEENGIYWTSGGDEQPYGKIYLHKSSGQIPNDFWGIEFGTNQRASTEIETLFGKRYFDFPKPTSLLMNLIKIGSGNNDIILDFFAGSGTTADSVLRLNNEEGTNRKFICVQLPEPIESSHIAKKDGYNNIADISKERIKKVYKYLKNKDAKGFLSYKLTNSNFVSWTNYDGADINELETLFSEQNSPLVVNWNSADLLNEIMLLEGFPLDSYVEGTSDKYGNNIFSVSSPECEHKLIICLDEKLSERTVNELALKGNDIFICLDTAISDKDKATLDDKGLIKTI